MSEVSMRSTLSILSIAGLAAVISMPALHAQDHAFAGGGFRPGFGPGHFEAGHKLVTGEPYTATRKTTHVEKLTNGATITHESTATEARDSSGKTYRALQTVAGNGSATSGSTHVSYSVFDPVNRLAINWNSDRKEASVFHFSDSAATNHSRADASAQGESAAATGFRHTSNAVVEQLGTKTISGVEATGTRSTITIPAGTRGNDQPLVITRERWVANDLGVTVLETVNDPRNGVSTTEVTTLQRGEPSAALFQAPAGYTVKDRYAGQRN
jgi:hypothetical protein